jgi:hypothetical protein
VLFASRLWKQSPRRAAAPRFRPRVEPLDGRCLPSVTLTGTYAAGESPNDVAVADLNHDGALDLVVADAGTYTAGGSTGGGVSVLLGKKDKKGHAAGTFGAATEYAVGPVGGVAVGDINGDANLDVVTSNGRVLLGNGDGTFRPGPNCPGGDLADVDGDGKLDLVTVTVTVTVTGNPTATLAVSLGNGDGTFRPGPSYSIPAPRAVAEGDFNHDGMADVLIATDTDRSVKLMTATGGGTLAPAQTALSFAYIASTEHVDLKALTVADFNADGKPDFAAAFSVTEDGYADYPPTDSFTVALGAGDGTFTQTGYGQFDTIYFDPMGMATGDFNHDGKLDLVGIGQGNFGVGTVNFGNGDGTFGSSLEIAYQAAYPPHDPTGFAVGDFNGDGYSDLAVSWWDGGSGPAGLDVLDFTPVTNGNKHK